MGKIKIGDKLQIHCYKHNGTLYRVCLEATVLDVNDDMLVCANYRAEISEHENINSKNFHRYFTKEPAILFFYKDCWFNIIVQIKDKGIYYYCNIASPFIIDDGLIKYIDYDLDLRVYPDGGFKVLDRNEYRFHRNKLQYSDDLDRILQSELSSLIKMKKNSTGAFDKSVVTKYYDIYRTLNKKIKSVK